MTTALSVTTALSAADVSNCFEDKTDGEKLETPGTGAEGLKKDMEATKGGHGGNKYENSGWLTVKAYDDSVEMFRCCSRLKAKEARAVFAHRLHVELICALRYFPRTKIPEVGRMAMDSFDDDPIFLGEAYDRSRPSLDIIHTKSGHGIRYSEGVKPSQTT